MNHSRCSRSIDMSPGHKLTPVRGVTLVDGGDNVLFAYGPVMLREALTAAEILTEQGFPRRVDNMPWLNPADHDRLADAVPGISMMCILEDQAPVCGLDTICR